MTPVLLLCGVEDNLRQGGEWNQKPLNYIYLWKNDIAYLLKRFVRWWFDHFERICKEPHPLGFELKYSWLSQMNDFLKSLPEKFCKFMVQLSDAWFSYAESYVFIRCCKWVTYHFTVLHSDKSDWGRVSSEDKKRVRSRWACLQCEHIFKNSTVPQGSERSEWASLWMERNKTERCGTSKG